jgi:uncharacterized repeat protein (TIGR01451 family)
MKAGTRLFASLSLCACITALAATLTMQFALAAARPTIQTDAPAYPAGADVKVTGSGWTANVTVNLTAKSSSGTTIFTASAVPDGQGNFVQPAPYYSTQTGDVGGTFTVTASQSKNTAQTTYTVSALAGFEIEGNSQVDVPPLHDWDQVWNDLRHQTDTAGTGSLQYTSDPVNSASDDEFSNSPKDTQDIDLWKWSKHIASSAKVDLADGLAAAYEVGTHQVLYVAADRYNSGPNSAISVWILHNPIGAAPNGTFVNKNACTNPSDLSTCAIEKHEEGDLLIVASLGSSPTVDAYRWQKGNLQSVSLTGQAKYAISIGPIDVPWSFKDATGQTKPQAQEFFELGVDLTAVFGGTPPSFSSFIITSRTSNSLTSSLSDFILGGISTYHGDIAVNKTAEASQVNAGDWVRYQIQVRNGGSGDDDIFGVTLSDPLPKGTGNDLTFVWAANGNPGGLFSIATNTTSQGCYPQPSPCQVLTFASNSQVVHKSDNFVATVEAKTSASDIGTLTNTAFVSALGDPNASNNTESASIVVMPLAVENEYAVVLNTPLVISNTNTDTSKKGVLWNDGLLANGTTPLAGYTAELVTGPTGAAPNGFTLNSDGSFNYTPINYAKPDSFTYRIVYTDGDGNKFYSNTATVLLTVNAGTLIVNKVVVNTNGGSKRATEFTFSVNGGTPIPFGAGADGDHGTTTLTRSGGATATYSITETPDTGYTAAYDNCTNVVLASGGTQTCTITNTAKPGTLIVKKLVVNNNGGSKHATDFSFSVDNGAATQFAADPDGNPLHGLNTLTGLSAGPYAITEPSVDGYATINNGCASVQVKNGETTICTITNDDQAATLTVTTIVQNPNGSDLPSIVTMSVTTGTNAAPASFTGSSSGVTVTLDAGPFGVSADPVDGYHVIENTCSGTIELNGSLTCTVTLSDGKAKPAIGSKMSWVLHDSLTITGIRPNASNAGDARVTFKLYGPNDSTCAGQVINGSGSGETVAIISGEASTQDGFKVLQAQLDALKALNPSQNGTYRWVAEYSGDAYNDGSATTCGDETHTITLGEPQQ